MGRPFSRHTDISRIYYFASYPGSRAVFLAEARTRKETRQIRELFDTVGQLAEVVPISTGTVMSYAVQVHGDTSLFGKIEWLLKTQFTFSLVERNFSDVTLHLVRSLCDDASAQMVELPSCGICGTADPFPTRATVEWKSEAEPLHLAYCSRCSARYAEEDPKRFLQELMRRDTTRLRIRPDVPVVEMPEIVEEHTERDTAALAIAI